ncbi:hypothetical protein Salat_0189500 [Sesamum alatum]|uniref:Uncharacterized protein n=1 Tax=Sesamum alatum TaxID=300844 RepID=A0AAE1YYC9_9LAMI|nr:hypothetical protein Salat_0189500 [Sesamum alatum]
MATLGAWEIIWSGEMLDSGGIGRAGVVSVISSPGSSSSQSGEVSGESLIPVPVQFVEGLRRGQRGQGRGRRGSGGPRVRGSLKRHGGPLLEQLPAKRVLTEYGNLYLNSDDAGVQTESVSCVDTAEIAGGRCGLVFESALPPRTKRYASFLMLCWALWRNRNRRRMEGVMWEPLRVVNDA